MELLDHTGSYNTSLLMSSTVLREFLPTTLINKLSYIQTLVNPTHPPTEARFFMNTVRLNDSEHLFQNLEKTLVGRLFQFGVSLGVVTKSTPNFANVNANYDRDDKIDFYLATHRKFPVITAEYLEKINGIFEEYQIGYAGNKVTEDDSASIASGTTSGSLSRAAPYAIKRLESNSSTNATANMDPGMAIFVCLETLLDLLRNIELKRQARPVQPAKTWASLSTTNPLDDEEDFLVSVILNRINYGIVLPIIKHILGYSLEVVYLDLALIELALFKQ